MLLPDFLVHDPDGFIRVAGHRIGLHHVVRLYNEGYSAEMLLGELPTLPLARIHKVIAFYLENEADVDAYVAAAEAEVRAHAGAAARGPGLAELRRRMRAVQRAEAS